jgi:hypothetical protein
MFTAKQLFIVKSVERNWIGCLCNICGQCGEGARQLIRQVTGNILAYGINDREYKQSYEKGS